MVDFYGSTYDLSRDKRNFIKNETPVIYPNKKAGGKFDSKNFGNRKILKGHLPYLRYPLAVDKHVFETLKRFGRVEWTERRLHDIGHKPNLRQVVTIILDTVGRPKSSCSVISVRYTFEVKVVLRK
ncbi:hypothetical protein BDF21DRAFT_394415 [Thamnidium elegans]|nr:hypothetical protein BDF21DRAFT_394415 [Thamnidium elegans]